MSSLSRPSSRTLRFKELLETDVAIDELIITSSNSTESRGQLPLWEEISASNPTRVAWISKHDDESMAIQYGGDEPRIVSLRDEKTICEFLSSRKILMDISGMPHDVWAPLLRGAYIQGVHTRVLYAEPESYKAHPSPASATLFDLSVTFDGLAPLPGFARLEGPTDDTKCLFIAALGFEGNRPERLALQIDPPPKVIPLVGVPGFQLEYPAYTVGCNRVFLDDYRAHSELRFARASCPFEAFEVLGKIRGDYPEHYMYLAPVGTKPHALGVILFAIANPRNTEILFDHPVRKAGRTSGIGVIHIYNFGSFDAY